LWKKEKSKSLNQYFLSKNITNAKNGKKIGVKIRKQNFQKHILHKKIGIKMCGREKRTQKYLDKNFWRQAFVLKN